MNEESLRKRNNLLDNLKGKNKIKINFVCSGNIIRSPYAEILFEHLIKNNAKFKNRIKVESSAVVFRNSFISPESRKALLLEGILPERINMFKPRYFGDFHSIYKMTDIILVMSKDHFKYIPTQYHSKTFLLLEFTDNIIVDVPDPYFDPPYSKTFQMIKQALFKLETQLELLII